jgi:hypothetical protein
MLDVMFDIPGMKNQKEFTVTLEYATEKLNKSTIKQLRVA